MSKPVRPSTLEAQVVLVTGANRGIGKAIVEAALQRGAAKVYTAVRNLDSAQPLVKQHGHRVVPIRVDVVDQGSINAAAELASDVQVVINNAGVMHAHSALDEETIDALRSEMDTNVYGLVRVAQAFASVLKKNGGGVLVQVNSVTSFKTFADRVTYCASKAAAHAVTKGLQTDLQKQGTRVVSVHPGPTKTGMGDAAGFGEAASAPSLVATAILDAVQDGSLYVWPGNRATKVGAAYEQFTEAVDMAAKSTS